MWIQIVFIRTYLYAWHTFCVNPYPQFLSTKKKYSHSSTPMKKMFPLFPFLYYASGYTCIFYVLLKHYRFFFFYPFSICIWKFCCSWGRSERKIGCLNDTKKKYNEAEKKIVLDKTSYKKKQSRDVFFLFMWISRNRKVYCLLGENKRFFFLGNRSRQ